MSMTAPTVVQVEPNYEGGPIGRLIGLRPTDPELLGVALGALGVAEAEVPDWTIYTGSPDHEIPTSEGPTAVLSPWRVSRQMSKHVGRSELLEADENEGVRYTPQYIHAFDKVVGHEVLHQLALSVDLREGVGPSRPLRIAARTAPVLSGAATYVGARQGLDANPLVALGLGFISQGIVGTHATRGVSPNRFASRRTQAALEENRALPHQIGRSVLPIYQKSAAAS